MAAGFGFALSGGGNPMRLTDYHGQQATQQFTITVQS